MRTCIKLRANTERDLSSKRSGWFLMLWSKVVLVLFVSGIRVVCQSQCFCRQAHNHHKDILSLQTGWKPTQSYMSCPTKLHTKGFKVSASHQGWPSPCWPLLVVNIIHQTSFLFYSLLCIEWKAPATDFKIAPKLDISHNNGGVFVSDKSLHSSCFLDESHQPTGSNCSVWQDIYWYIHVSQPCLIRLESFLSQVWPCDAWVLD